MDELLLMISAVASVFSVMAVGGIARRLEWLTHEADESLLKLVIRVLMPCFIFGVIVGNDRLRDPAAVWVPPVVGFLSVAVGCLVAWWFARLLGPRIGLHDARQQRTFGMCVGIFNYGYIPVPIIQSLFPEDGTLGVLLIHNVGVEVALWTVGVLVLTGGLGRQWWKRLINPPIMAIALSVVINAWGLDRWLPVTLMATVSMIGACAIPMGLIMIGAVIADHWNPAGFTNGAKVIASATVLRLGLFAIAGILLARWLPVAVELKRVMVIEAAMPAAVFPIVMAKHYGGDPGIALRVIFGTSVIALITIPLCLMYGLPFATGG